MGHRDLKNSPRASRSRATSPRSSGGGGVMMGVVIGLIIGVAAVVGAVMYFSHAATPFTNLQKQQASASEVNASSPTQILTPGINETGSAPAAAESPAAPAPAASAPTAGTHKPAKGAHAASAAAAQRFDFYKILPGQIEAVTNNDQGVADSTTATTGKKLELQLGAFQNQDDADNLKAKLALLGIEATIQSVSVPGKGMLHRVRVGPFASKEELERTRTTLKHDGILTVKSAN